MIRKIVTFNLFLVLVFTISFGQDAGKDWRNIENALSVLPGEGYCDQPYVVVLNNGTWLCVFTTNAGNEGAMGQHIVSCTSDDQGKIWSNPINIVDPGKESVSWAMPYLTKYGRVYVLYIYNDNKIHSLDSKKDIREDMLGWYCYKYSDDDGKTWSQRYRLDVRKTAVDLNNDWKGKVQIMWGIGKPIDVDEGMMFAFTKIGKYMLDYSEGWFFRCNNINYEKDPDKLEWSMLPQSQYGLKNEALGPINAEQNIVQMNNGAIYCMYRTISGHPAESYSYNGGKSWTLPRIPEYENGIEIKNPRACPRIWKCKNGKTVKLRTSDYGSIEIVLNDGNNFDIWNSDPGLIPAYGEHCISVTVDNGPKIIQFVIDGIVCNGRDFRQYGWGRFNIDMEDFDFNEIEVGKLIKGQLRPEGKLTKLRIYDRPLMNTELIGNHKNFRD